MNEMLTDTAEDRIRYMKAYMPEEFEVPVFWDDGSVNERKTIRLKDLEWKYIYEFEFESIKDINKIVERWQFGELVNAVKVLWQDPASQTWNVNNQQLLKNGMNLFNQNPDIILSQDDYYKKVEEAKKKAIDMEAELMNYVKEMQSKMQPTPSPEAIPSPEGSTPAPEAGPTEVWASEIWVPVPPGEAKEPMTVANILKQVNE